MKLILSCPNCSKTWGTLKFNFESIVDKKNIKPLKKEYKFIDEEQNLICPICKYKYKIFDIYNLILRNIK